MTESELDSPSSQSLSHIDVLLAALLATLTFLSRYILRGELYFVDGPRIVAAIRSGRYIVQPPGYWLLAHLGGLFHDPVFGLALCNELFSAFGVMILFFLCRKLCVSRTCSAMAALAYSSVFFVWFSGEIHSAYASQILFAPLIVYCFFSYKDRPSLLRLLFCSLAVAIGTGLRPSDGVFLGPLCLYLMLTLIPKPAHRVWFVCWTGLLCLTWYIPTRSIMEAQHMAHGASWLSSMSRDVSPLVAGINERTIANVIRVILPAAVAFWMLLPAMFSKRSPRFNWVVVLWAAPGLLFFTLIYMADATYLTFLAGAFILAAALAQNRRIAVLSLMACCVFNTALYLGARPILHSGTAVRAFNFYIVKCCNYGIRHQWSSTIGRNDQIPL